jgi:hypothetical protein
VTIIKMVANPKSKFALLIHPVVLITVATHGKDKKDLSQTGRG